MFFLFLLFALLDVAPAFCVAPHYRDSISFSPRSHLIIAFSGALANASRCSAAVASVADGERRPHPLDTGACRRRRRSPQLSDGATRVRNKKKLREKTGANRISHDAADDLSVDARSLASGARYGLRSRGVVDDRDRRQLSAQFVFVLQVLSGADFLSARSRAKSKQSKSGRRML